MLSANVCTRCSGAGRAGRGSATPDRRSEKREFRYNVCINLLREFIARVSYREQMLQTLGTRRKTMKSEPGLIIDMIR